MSLSALVLLDELSKRVIRRCALESRVPSVRELLDLAGTARAAGLQGLADILQRLALAGTHSSAG